MDVKAILDTFNIEPDIKKEQFFLVDDDIRKEMVKQAMLSKDDVVLEIGTGNGLLTREIAKYAGRVISFEVDTRFKQLLSNLPENVELHFEDAWKYVQLHGKWIKQKEYNKVISNLPYSFVEKFLHNLTFLCYDEVILLVPIKFMRTIETNAIFSSFFKVEILMMVDKRRFYPVPRTSSVLIRLIKLPDPIKERNLRLFLRQYMYQHESQKTRNSLMEGLITYLRLTENKTLTKNEARKMVSEKILDTELLDKTPGMKIYPMVSEAF